MSSSNDNWLHNLFIFHIGFAALSGAAAVLYPSFWHMFFTVNEKGSHKELLDTAIQLYGSLIVGQSILVYTLRNQLFTPRNKPSRDLRQGVCLAYCVVFALSTALVLKAQLAGVMNVAASVNSVLFVSLAGAYGLLFFRGMSGAPSKHTAH